MNAHEDFLETFKYAVSNRELVTLANHLEHNWKLLAIVSIEHCESIVCGIFDRRDGLLYFLDDELEKDRSSNKFVDDALKHGFAFLEFCIRNFHETPCFVQYIPEIKNVCKLGITKRTTQYILKNACKAFNALIELFGDHESLELTEIVERFVHKHCSYDPKARRWIFSVLGKIIKHKRDISLSPKCINIIFLLLKSDAFGENRSHDAPLMEFYMYFDALADMLSNPSIQPPDPIRQGLFSTAYRWIKRLSQQDNQQYGKKTKESGIALLSSHVIHFRDLLYRDYRHWYDVLKRLSREGSSVGRYALRTFYRVIGEILAERNTAENKNILLYFQQEFQTVLKDTNLDTTTFQLTIYGFSQMAAPCNRYLGEDSVREIYSMITTWALPLCSNEESDAESIEKVCYYQEELSAILREISDVTIEKVNVLAVLSVYTIKRFPEANSGIVVSSLIKIIRNLGTISRTLLQRYLDDIIFDGVLWSCSHTLAVDAELQRELSDSQTTPVCYKNYLPLWTELLNAKRYTDERLVKLVADTLVNECVTAVGRLDLRVKQKPPTSEEQTALSNVAFTQIAVNQTDFRVFANLVDLYVDVIDKSEPSLFAGVVHGFLREVVRLSHQHPLVSGFYKLARVGMKVFTRTSLAEGEEGNEGRNEQTRELLSDYVTRTLDLVPAFSEELLIACLHLILHAPLAYVEDALPRTLPMFRIAFTVGLGDLELAHTALVALRAWTAATGDTVARRRDERASELLRELVPHLEPYLRSTESAADTSRGLTAMTARRHVRRVDVIDDTERRTLRGLQRQILLFLGSLGHNLLADFAHDRASRSIGVSWDRKDLLGYTVPLPNEIRPRLHFDRMLPKIMTLARDSSDRRTKVAACEVLHSLVALVAGTAKQNANDEKYLAVYIALCPTVLALGCDGDEVVRKLYWQLALQLMRWLCLVPKLTDSVIECLLDSLTDNSNPAVREFAGKCLAEFTSWSDRHELGTSVRSNVRKVVQKINNLALHLSAHKRVAAAVAFNHLHRILRADYEIVSAYWLEIFYCFVRSSDGCDDPSIAVALTHIEKVVQDNADLLNVDEARDRQKPPEFDEATLTHALYWLLSQCGVLDERCRARCMELYASLSRCVGKSARETTQAYVKAYGRDRLNDIILKGLTRARDVASADGATSLLRALDYYVWLIEKQSLPVETLFPAGEDATIFSCIRGFAQQFLRAIREPATRESGELELRALQCKALVATFNFLQVLLNVDANVLPESLWTESLAELTVQCVMCPRSVGFDVRNIEMTDDRLPRVLEALLSAVKSRLPDLPESLAHRLRSARESLAPRLRRLREIAQTSSEVTLTQKLGGLMLLRRCDMLPETSEFREGDEMIAEIFRFLVGDRARGGPTASMVEYLRALMEFRLSLAVEPADVRSTMETLLGLLSDDAPMNGLDSAGVTRGDYFLGKFESAIFGYAIAHRDAIAPALEELARDHPAFSLRWVEGLVLYLKRHRRELRAHVDGTVDAILRQFARLERAAGGVDSRRERLTSIYGTAVRLRSRPTEAARESRELYQWILDQLTRDAGGFERKMLVLRNFLVCLTDAEDRESDKLELWGILQQMLNGRSESGASAVATINGLETLLVLLLATRSVITLKCVMHFVAVGAGDRPTSDERLRECLHQYYHGASHEHVLRSLEATYRAFMHAYTAEAERLAVLRGFLLPALEYCDVAALESFLRDNVRGLREIADQRVDGDRASAERTLVSKIGYFQLMTVMFSRLDKSWIDGLGAGGPRSFSRDVFLASWETRWVSAGTAPPEGCGELARRLRCAAYNCSLAIICLKEEGHKGAFCQGSPSKCVWESVVDRNKHYSLGQTFKKPPRSREVTVNVRYAGREAPARGCSYVRSYDLSACTLSEDINAYDFNKRELLPAGSRPSDDRGPARGATSIVLESDDFNEHECMPYICILLRRVKDLFGASDAEPEWLQYFFGVCPALTHPNFQLFTLKIVTNAADVFKSHARFALTPLARVTADYLERHGLNYIVTDILELLIDWRDDVAAPSERDRTEVQRLFEAVVDKVLCKSPEEKRAQSQVHRYNLGLMRSLAERWRECLRAPSDDLMRRVIRVAPDDATYLVLAFLRNGMAEAIVATDYVVEFLLGLLNRWETSRPAETACLVGCECLGLCLEFLSRDEAGRELRQQILGVLGARRLPHDTIKQVRRVAYLCRGCPDAAADYVRIAIAATITNANRSYCLEIFHLAMPRLDAIGIVDDLHHIRLDRVLENPVCERLALRIVDGMVTIVSPAVLLPYVRQTIRYVKDNATEHRELVYDALMSVYRKYADVVANDDVRELMSISARHLLAALLDPCPELQEKVLQFWAEETELATDSPKDRLLALLDVYTSRLTPGDDAVFAPFVALLMLRLAARTRDYDRAMFERPLHPDSVYENDGITILRRGQRSLSSATPMFVDSLAAQMNHGVLSQSVDGAPALASLLGRPPRLRATQDSTQFERTLVEEDEPATATFDATFASLDAEFDRARARQSPTTRGRPSFRFLASSSDVARLSRRKQMRRNEQRVEIIKQENVRQQSSVRLYRNYRKGDYPDIQIPHSSLIVPLQRLIMLDRLICKDVTVSLLCALIEDIKEVDGDFRHAVVEKLKRILQDSCERSSSFSAIVLETLLKLRIVDCNPRDVMKISKVNGLNTLGILLLEERLLSGMHDDVDSEPPSKRARGQDDDETDEWAQLAFLYKSLNDVDVVLSIFREQQSFGQHIQEAALAEVNGDWDRAKRAFEEGYRQAEKLSLKEHCMQGLLEAVTNLCDWSAVDRLVKSRINRDLNNIWNDSWRDWMIPCVCDAYTCMYGTNESWPSKDADITAVGSWLNDRDRQAYVKSAIGENLVMNLLTSSERQQVADLLNDLLDRAAEQWAELSPLCAELGIRRLQKLQALSDLEASLKVLRCTSERDRVDRLADLLDFWSTKAPTTRDSLVHWNKLVAFRVFSSTLIELSMDDDDDEDCVMIDDALDRKRGVVQRMRRAVVQLRLDVGNAALSQRHRYIARKYLNYIKKRINVRSLNMEIPLAWLEARTECLCADLESDAGSKMAGYTASWELSHELLDGQADGELRAAFRQHIGLMASRIESLSRESGEFAGELTGNAAILRRIGTARAARVDLDAVRRSLLQYSLDSLSACCKHAGTSRAAGEHYCALAKHCYGRLATVDTGSAEIFRVFLSSTLRSMRHGHLEAAHYFPCLLRPEQLAHEETRAIFDRECAKLRPWLFLRWRDLLFSHLDTSIADAVAPIVERLAEAYPDAVVYAYHLADERHPGLQRAPKLRSLLGGKAAEYKRLLEAIEYVAQPELYLKYHLDETMRKLSRKEVASVDSLLEKLDSAFGGQAARGKGPRAGKVYHGQGLADCVKRIELLKNIDPGNQDELRGEVQRIKHSLDRSLRSRGVKACRLRDYSPFLHEYTGGGGVEIPGQYSGDGQPTPSRHVKLARFEPDVAVMPSLRKPIRINMIGDNGREYKFLVKFGEDLTVDRGLQQLYATMNRTLRNDAGCGQRRLAIDTYEVIPLSRSHGLIQWIEGTKSLEDLVTFSLVGKEIKERYSDVRENYESWIAGGASTMPQRISRYRDAVSRYGRETVTAKMRQLIGETKRSALRDTLAAIGTSPECFVTVRRNFVTSYATMCAAHWLAGIGDRHLQNTLVHVATGRCLGIDFGHSFGSAIRAPIPELVPFRLTPQILELLRPFTERDLLATIMTHALRALRDDRGPILACMDIFVHRPASRSLGGDDEMIREDIDTDLTWSSRKNIEIVAKKLNGIHPSLITLEQLGETHDDKYFERYRAIVTGNDGIKQARADKADDCLTPAEQVECLLDQAKDLNILGRMYANWQPWL